MQRRGFTIVELLVVIAIMGILLILGVVNLRSTQANGRDSERKTDVETIALHLESYYTSGSDTLTAVGYYPSVSTLIGNEKSVLRDIDPASLVAPGDSASSLVAATNAVQTSTGVQPQPSLTTNDYVYQPIRSDGSLCTGLPTCRKFNLYYYSEVDNSVKMITSKNQ